MCSPNWPELLGPHADDVMLDAVTRVAERNFFAVVEPCDDRQFAVLADQSARWLVAAVHFTEGDCSGAVSCTVSEHLANALFDAFSGRDQLDPAPDPQQLLDLVGEFSNMICGAWLTRLAVRQTFTLSSPTVRHSPDPSQLTTPQARMLLAVNDLPLAVEVRVAPATEGVPATTGA